MGLLDRGSRWLGDVLVQREGVPVTIRRGGSITDDVLAVPGRTTAIQDDGDGVLVSMFCADFLIAVDDYMVDGVAVLPNAGDLLIEAAPYAGADRPTFEVLPFAGEPHERYSDRYRRVLRIHAKEVAPVREGTARNRRAAAWSLFWNPPFPDGDLDVFDRRQSWGGYPN